MAIVLESSWLALVGKNSRRIIVDDTSGRGDSVDALALASEGSGLAVADNNGTVQIWNTATGGHHDLADHRVSAHTVAMAPDGTWLATADYNGRVRTWDSATGQYVATLTDGADFVTAMAIAPGGDWLATGDTSGEVRIWDTAAAQPDSSSPPDSREWICGLAASPDGTQLTTADSDGTVSLCPLLR